MLSSRRVQHWLLVVGTGLPCFRPAAVRLSAPHASRIRDVRGSGAMGCARYDAILIPSFITATRRVNHLDHPNSILSPSPSTVSSSLTSKRIFIDAANVIGKYRPHPARPSNIDNSPASILYSRACPRARPRTLNTIIITLLVSTTLIQQMPTRFHLQRRR